MFEASTSPLWPKIILPLVLGAALRISPQAVQVIGELRKAAWAEAHASQSSAVSYLETISDVIPWRSDLLERAGQDALEDGDIQKAICLFEAAQAKGRLSAGGMNGLARAHYLSGNIQAAVETWMMLTQTSNPPVDVYLSLAAAEVELGDVSGAIIHLQSGATRFPDQPDLLFYLGELLAIEQPDQALPVLLQVASLQPDLDPPVREIQAALNSVPVDADPAYRFLLTGRGLASISDWDLAKAAFKKAVAARPDYAEAWAFLGEARQQTGEDGTADLKQALEINPDSVLVQALWSVYWQREGNDVQAQTYLAAATELEPENPIWQIELGNSLANSGDLEGAAASFQKAVDLRPDEVAYWVALAEFSIVNGYKIDELGLPAARQAVFLDPDNTEALDLMGQAFLKSGDNLSAERILLEALAVNPEDTLVRLHLGIAYLYQEKTDEAYQCFKEILVLAPESWEGGQAEYYLKNYFQN